MNAGRDSTTSARDADDRQAAGSAGAEGGSGVDRTAERSGVRSTLRAVEPIWFVLLALVVVMIWLSPLFAQPPVILGLIQRAAPLVILAAGQYFVIVSGEFDLSVGSLVTVVVILASGLMSGDPSTLWWVLGVVLALGLVVGGINAVVTTRLGVPSILTTLGTLLILRGAAYQLSGGSPQGNLASNFRLLGRGRIEGLPLIGSLPYAVIVLVVVGAVAIYLMNGTDYGKRLLAVGGNERAAALSGVDVPTERSIAFVLSALSAVVAGVLLGGFAGESAQAGLGLELQAISAVVLGGVVIGGGRGRVTSAMAGALTLEVLFTVLNLLGLPSPIRAAAQGFIIIAALAYAAYRFGGRR
jgi:ribose transport system permease protein